MENVIYFEGEPIGVEYDGIIVWLPGVSPETINQFNNGKITPGGRYGRVS